MVDVSSPELRVLVGDAILSALYLIPWYLIVKRTTDGSERRLSWILTLGSSTVCTVGCESRMVDKAYPLPNYG